MLESLHLIPAYDEGEWSRWLDPLPHDFYHTAAYHRFSEQSGEGEGWLAVYGTRHRYLAWPHLIRRLSGGAREHCDVTSVYGYAGPLAYGCSSDEAFLAGERIAAWWRAQNVVSVFTRFHPLVENEKWTSDHAQPSGITVSIDLGLPEATNWHDYQAGLRNRIHHGRRLGLATEIDDGWSHLEDFVRFYHDTMTRNHALPQYSFPIDYFRRLRQALRRHAFLFATRFEGDIAAAGIFIEYRGIVQNHFCVNNARYLRLAPSKVLLDDVRRWAKARGNRVFHLGGGRSGARDSLFEFKAAFSPRRHVFYTGRSILNRNAYASLCDGLPVEMQNFFPAYRASESWRSA